MKSMGSEYEADSGQYQSELNDFFSQCEKELSNPSDFHKISVAVVISVSSKEVIANLQTDEQMASDLGLREILPMEMHWQKAVCVDAIGAIANGLEGAVAASAIACIMMA